MRHKIKKLKRNNKKIFESSLTVNKNKDILRFLKREPLFVLKVKKKKNMCYVLRHHVNPEAEVNTWG